MLTETVVYGDRAAANGLTVRLDSTYADHLFWDTTCTLDAQTRTETEYSFSASAVNETRPHTYSCGSYNSYRCRGFGNTPLSLRWDPES